MTPEVGGEVAPGFEAHPDTLAESLASGGDIGASVCVHVAGEKVVDVWGGAFDRDGSGTYGPDTLQNVYSTTKGATAVCVALLADRGLVDYDAKVAEYWPEFAAAGKGDITVRLLLNHQAGLAALREPIPEQGLCDWELVVDTLAAQEPLWVPGTRHGYSALTFGHLIGEVVRRITGRTIGTFFREEVAEPLGLDFWIGLPEDQEHRVAPNISADVDPAHLPTFYQAALTDPSSVAAMVVMNSGGILMPDAVNNRRVHAAEIPAANGITNARGLAGMYRPLALEG